MKQIKSFPIKTIQKEVAGQYSKVFHTKVFTLFASSECVSIGLAKGFPKRYEYCFCFLKDEQGQWFGDGRGQLAIRNFVIKQAEKDPRLVLKYYTKWLDNFNKFTEFNKILLNTKLEKLTDKKLYAGFKKYYDLYVKAGGVGYICDSFMSTGEIDWLEEILDDELQDYSKDERKQIIADLITPTWLSSAMAEEQDLIKIALRISKLYGLRFPVFEKLDSKIKIALKKHSDKYYWIKNNYHNVEYYSAKDAYSSAQQLLREEKNRVLTQRLQDTKLSNTIKLSKQKQNIVWVANLFAEWKDLRKTGVLIVMEMFDRFLSEVARRTGYTKIDLTFVVFDEIENVLFNKADLKKEISERKKKCFFLVKPSGEYIVAGDKDADKYFACLVKSVYNSREFRGVTASKGVATGRVRLILKIGDMNSFQTGEILVTNNTTPEFVPVMKKAAAIITEQGGLTSHAAIVSRELNKPCIIGIKNIATILKTGDMVEVDADHGIVKIL